jgi:hypothetical protein
MTAQDILDLVEEKEIGVSDFAYGDFELEELGEWEEIDQYGGEGQGDNWWSVKHFKDHNVYIKTTGFYSSYNGTDFEDGYGSEVVPKEKTIIVYE